jgi:hypothetical protein
MVRHNAQLRLRLTYQSDIVHLIAEHNQNTHLLTGRQKMDISEIRYKNFEHLFEQFKEETRRVDPGAPDKGMLKLFGARLGIREAYMSHIKTKFKNIGPTTARQIEQALGLAHGWMDQQHGKKRATEPAPAPAPQAGVAAPAEIPETTDADEIEFLENAILLYRKDPLGAQNALLRVMASKFK